MNCSVCGHEDMVHFMWAGCCGLKGCPCEGTDGAQNCRNETHGGSCWWAVSKVASPPLTRNQAEAVWALHDQGIGTRKISDHLGLKRPLVMQTIREEWWPRPGTPGPERS